MTELERQLLSAFEKLSTQYETEQKRQAAQINNLSNQVQILAKALTNLTNRLTELSGD